MSRIVLPCAKPNEGLAEVSTMLHRVHQDLHQIAQLLQQHEEQQPAYAPEPHTH
eukprot:NODE_2108_length_764_cov_122.213986_g1696_i0.p4 GENE.NODE_2108_length_764_cov_122.213986_g1696_i0~~NODE_2108_length_764_cov_122.213986_g1696_i0.p4  ORF type:complete len:54 (-),score=10.48 NODE_2108_length_764_cov_122.213986_g1696_i0:548-709(-)